MLKKTQKTGTSSPVFCLPAGFIGNNKIEHLTMQKQAVFFCA
ncbi:hypothetical protein DB29_00224 [Shouchella clausii]|nr:hypothetical protein DB29_00224 [Shouchella clausii]